jgi:division protein CdvB (Snf7/Vps24/ESCRT-III family)
MELFYKEYHARQEFLKRGTYMMLDKQVRESIVSIIDNLNTMNVDGETMEFIIKNVGMEDQMLSQLGYPLRVENESLKHRLQVIAEDVVSSRRWICGELDDLNTHLNNIEIACDLSSDESLTWNTKS